MQSSSSTKVDTELVKQLKTASGDEELVEAVFRLRPDDPSEIVPAADRTETVASQLLERVKKKSGQPAARFNVFKNLGSFVVSAHPSFIQELMAQPEVAAVLANRQPGSALIPPVKKAPVPDVTPKKRAVPAKRKRVAPRAASKKSARKAGR